MTQRGRSAARVQKVQRVQRVQRVVVSPPLAAMNMKSALRDCLPVLIVILSRRRRISVRIANERNVDKYQSAGRLPPSSHPRIFRCSSGLRPAPFRSGKQKEGPFMGRLRANFARLGNPMQDCHLGKEPNVMCFPIRPIVILLLEMTES